MTGLISLALGSAIAGVSAPPLAPLSPADLAPSIVQPQLMIQKIETLDEVDASFQPYDNKADLYAQITVDGWTYETPIVKKNEAEPYWSVPLPVDRPVYVHIRLLDQDHGFEEKDDHLDINPQKQRRDLYFRFDPRSSAIVGDLNGYMGTSMTLAGKSDDRARITLGIY